MNTNDKDTCPAINEDIPYAAAALSTTITHLLDLLEDHLRELSPAVDYFAAHNEGLHAEIDVDEFRYCRTAVEDARILFAGVPCFLESGWFTSMVDGSPRPA